MDVVSTLNDKLLEQPFTERQDEASLLNEYKAVAARYSQMENSIAVLSNLRSNKSYIFYGGVAEKLGIDIRNSQGEIDSIWEDEIFSRIHPDDLDGKHLLELQFFHLLKKLLPQERCDYHITSKMRMLDNSGEYIYIHHRMFYVSDSSSGSLWLALCLYNYSYDKEDTEVLDRTIANSRTGETIRMKGRECYNILSFREKEILQLIDQGRMSKEIADVLSISKNTVDRHRQNILEKLRVKNSIEACRIARLMNLL